MPVSTFLATGTFANPDGSAATGTVTFTPIGRSTPASTVIDPKPVVATITAGAISQTLVVTGGSYQVVEAITGASPVSLVISGAGGNVDLSTVAVPTPPPAGAASLTPGGGILLGKSAPALNATDGFPWIPVVAGTPNGAPVAETGFSPVVYDSTGKRLWVYDYVTGSWLADPANVQSATAAAVATGGTIATAAVSVARVAPAAAVTGVILAPGNSQGQQVTVINEAASGNTVTFAVAGTSNVADGAGSALAGLTARTFTWDTATSLWYRSA